MTQEIPKLAPSAAGGPAPGLAASMLPSSRFFLTPASDDTALFRDLRIGFSHLLPGRPSLGVRRLREDTLADAVVHLRDAPITLRYQVEAPKLPDGAASLVAELTAKRRAATRARAVVETERPNDTWLGVWGAEAAAVTAYVVPPSDFEPETREDLFVLVRQGLVLCVTWSYPRAFVSDPTYAAFAAVAEATMVWDEGRWEQRGLVWPSSAFAGRGLCAPPPSRFCDAAAELVQVHLLPGERQRILSALATIVGDAGAPWLVLAPDAVLAQRTKILTVVQNERVRAFVERAFAEIVTAHDLRGLAVLTTRALEDGAAVSEKRPSADRRSPKSAGEVPTQAQVLGRLRSRSPG